MRCLSIAPLEWLAMLFARLPQRAVLGLGRALGLLSWPLLASRRRVARINLALCLPELSPGQQARLLRGNIIATATGALELCRAWYAPARALEGLAQIEGLEHLRQAMARGQGVLLLCGHFTHTELAARLLTQALGSPVRVVVRRHNHPCLERWFEAARQRVFGPTLAKKDMRALLRSLQSGQLVVYSADQNFTYQNVFVPFFGVPAATLTAVPQIVKRGQAQLSPFWFHRDDSGKYRLRIEAAWPDWATASDEESAAIYMRELELAVRERPEQYLWVHRRFKTRPPGEPAVY